VSNVGQKSCRFKRVGNLGVGFANYFVNCLFPAWIGIAAFFDVDVELAKRRQSTFKKLIRYLEFVGFVIMVVQCFKHVAFSGDSKLGWISDSFAQGLSGIFLNLDVEEFSEVGEPFDQLRSSGSVKLDVGEISFEDV